MGESIHKKDEFENVSGGKLGVILIDPASGKQQPIAVDPGASVFLSEDEQILTANAPRKDEDNPFTNGSLKLISRAHEIKNRRPIGDGEGGPPSSNGSQAEVPAPVEPEETEPTPPEPETAAATPPAEPAPQGQRAPGEEAGTPITPKRAPTARNTVKAGPAAQDSPPLSPQGVPEPRKAPEPVAKR